MSIFKDDTNNEKKYKIGETILNDLMHSVKECQSCFGGKKELATEDNLIVAKLCAIWENALSYGLKNSHLSVLKNVHEIIGGSSSEISPWDVFKSHLTKHETERFNSMQRFQISTKNGKLRALIRVALNEHSLERYILMWVNDPNISDFYEPWSLMINPEATHLLPSLASGLNSILFAIAVDLPDFNSKKTDLIKGEPIIYAPKPTECSKKTTAIKRRIISLEDNIEQTIEDILPQPTTEYKITEGVCEGLAEISIEPSLEIDNLKDVQSNSIEHSQEDSSSGALSTISDANSRSTSSPFEYSKMEKLEQTLKFLQERCATLESMVAELSLENRRLHRLLTNSNISEETFEISIPRAVLNSNRSRKHYEYEIHIKFKNSGTDHTILKRYREFYSLHQNLKKKFPVINTLDFPPKKKIGNMDSYLVEDRRQRLQFYLRYIVTIIPGVNTSSNLEDLQKVLPFFVPS